MKGKFKCESTTIIVVDFAMIESLTLFKKGLKITLYALAGRYFGSDGMIIKSCLRLTGARYLNRTITPRAVRGTLSLTGARHCNRTIPPRAVRGTYHLISLYSTIKGFVKYRTVIIEVN